MENANIPWSLDGSRTRLVYRMFNAAATTINLDLNKFANGMYFVQINNGTKPATQKIIIQK